MATTEPGYTVILTSTPTQIIRAVFKDTTVHVQKFDLVADIELTWGEAQELSKLVDGVSNIPFNQLIDADVLHALVYPSGTDNDRPSTRIKKKRQAEKEGT